MAAVMLTLAPSTLMGRSVVGVEVLAYRETMKIIIKKSAAFSPAICAEIIKGFQSADAKLH